MAMIPQHLYNALSVLFIQVSLNEYSQTQNVSFFIGFGGLMILHDIFHIKQLPLKAKHSNR